MKSTGEKVRVVILPSTVMANVAATKGRDRSCGAMWAGRLCPDGLALVGRDSVEPEGRCRFTRPCAFFSSTESRPADEEFVFNFAALLAFGDLMLQCRHLSPHLA